MKKTILILLFINSMLKAEISPIEEMIYDSVNNAFKTIPQTIENVKDNAYSNKRSYTSYVNENNAIKRKLTERKINYQVIVKQRMYSKKFEKKGLFASKKEIMYENEILRELAIRNDISVSEKKIKTKNKETLERERSKEELKKQMNIITMEQAIKEVE